MADNDIVAWSGYIQFVNCITVAKLVAYYCSLSKLVENKEGVTMVNGVLTLGACDDNEVFLQNIQKTLFRYKESNDMRCKMLFFSSGEDLLSQPPEIWDIVLLDVEMPGMDGFEVAQRLRVNKCRAKIIFLTNHKECWSKGYDVKAYHFVVKSDTARSLNKVLDAALDEILQQDSIFLEHMYNKEFHHVYIDEIQSIQALGDNTAVYAGNLVLRCRKSLGWWLAEYPQHFTKCHRSYIVNPMYISRINKSSIIMQNNTSVLLSVRLRRKFLAQLHTDITRKSNYME